MEGVLVTTGIWALFVALALWPPFRSGGPGFVVFLATMTLNEIPLIPLVVLLFAVNDGLPSLTSGEPTGLVSAALAAFAGLGLIWLQVRARTAGPILEAALKGVDGAASSRPAGASGLLGGETWLKGILLPFQRRQRGVQRTRNVRYGPDPRAHLLDVYRGREPSGSRPVLIHLHGGGFVQGGKSREGVVLLNQLAGRGWLCISANYRLRGAGAFPNPLVDAKRVIAWAREHAAEYGADPSQVFLAGASAGGHLAVSAALTSDQARFQPGFEQAETSVRGVIVLYGYLGPRTSEPSSSPAELARPDAPPLLIISGEYDTMVPPEGPRAVAATLRAASLAPVIYAELPQAQHDFDFFASVRARVVANAAEAFLSWALRRPAGPVG